MEAGDPRSVSDDRAALTLSRLLPRLERTLTQERERDPQGWAAFEARLRRHFPALFTPLLAVYGIRYDFFYHLERFLELAAASWFARAPELRDLDTRREIDPDWFLQSSMVGGVCYVDRFACDLDGIRARIPYFTELGLTYLHLMPLFRSPEGNNDGGYAVSSYREVNPALGTMEDLADLAAELRRHDISLVLDFVFNHTSDEHDWALEARAHPDDEERNAYLMFPDRTLPDAYDRTLREIFPEQRPGSFTWYPDIDGGRWVWTTFHSFQWDLNYANPEVFRRMAGEMLFLANRGVEVLRLDAVAFIWKRLGTTCESLPEAHLLVRAFNAMARIAAPALVFKSEAIVHPAMVVSYIDPAECQLSYNPLLMALLWETLATRQTRLLVQSMRRWFTIPEGCAWVNYVRSHDDIGWTFDDADAAVIGINGFDHRQFLNAFYTGRFPGSFARGLPFQENPNTGDARISGTAASLAGLEKALHEEGPAEEELALKRVLLLYGIAMAMGGIPLIYLGDELATLNDYGYLTDPEQAEDSRWVHRPVCDPTAFAHRDDPTSLEGRMTAGLRRLLSARTAEPAFANVQTRIIDTGNGQVFGFTRHGEGRTVLVLANVTEEEQTLDGNLLRLYGQGYALTDALTGTQFEATKPVTLAPYQLAWLAAPAEMARGMESAPFPAEQRPEGKES